ncbi:hypothetical protein BGX38DRAFT_1191482 [Terfezia claveryi]|nr:hypothetical protein BGX38DRAFT_1191482 [Terfezia claveryi]
MGATADADDFCEAEIRVGAGAEAVEFGLGCEGVEGVVAGFGDGVGGVRVVSGLIEVLGVGFSSFSADSTFTFTSTLFLASSPSFSFADTGFSAAATSTFLSNISGAITFSSLAHANPPPPRSFLISHSSALTSFIAFSQASSFLLTTLPLLTSTSTSSPFANPSLAFSSTCLTLSLICSSFHIICLAVFIGMKDPLRIMSWRALASVRRWWSSASKRSLFTVTQFWKRSSRRV